MRTIERLIPTTRERVWQLWTTPEGISSWWAPEGFRTDVEQLELRVGGDLIYTMTAVAPEQIAFMEQYGMPLATQSRKVFTAVAGPDRLGYRSLIDFVPDHEPYEQLTEIDLSEVEGGTRVVMRMEPLHDDIWTERLVAGRTNELENLAHLVES